MAEDRGPGASVVIGTAGHIDHGKTTLLRALTGIDADRLPEERRRGMTIEVGYAHLALPDERVVDFVDVPGHDRLVGNMLVGAGEIDAALLVVAADDGPNAQTLEHLELLDALGIARGLAVITKADLAPDSHRRAALRGQVEALLARTTLAGVPVQFAAAPTGEGIDALRVALAALAESVAGARDGSVAEPSGLPRLAIDRVFGVKGRGTVVTGSLRGGSIAAGATLRLQPAGIEVRVREVQVRGEAVDAAHGGRTALLLGGVEPGSVRRGAVLTAEPGVVATSRILVALRPPAALDPRRATRLPADREPLRLHAGTDQVDALVVRGPREAIDLPDGSALAILRLARPVATSPGDRFALRRPSPGATAGGGMVLDALPPRGISRRRLTADRAARLAAAAGGDDPATLAAARLDLHGALGAPGAPGVGGLPGPGSAWRLAADVEASVRDDALALVRARHAAEPDSPGLPLPSLRTALALAARRRATLDRAAADVVARDVVDRAIAEGSLARDGDRVRDPARAGGPTPAGLAAMDRLEQALATPAPPPLATAARDAGCPPDGVRALETAGRIVRLEDDLAWAATTYRDLVKRALAMAAAAPLTPAAFRDETGTSRRYVLVILEDLDRRGLLRRTDAGHVLGPKTIAKLQARAAAAASTPSAVPSAPPAAPSAPSDPGAPEPAG
ncbi:MAG TPA: selenocysteine-specific translation elongation factor [Candidatus Limnocylindrales bacterium]|nr:selenocysteine-specific translation elongation factor [Candidatus Limnocylindrales bacterium]